MRRRGSVLDRGILRVDQQPAHTQEPHEIKSITIRALAKVRKGRSFNLDLATAWDGLGISFDQLAQVHCGPPPGKTDDACSN